MNWLRFIIIMILSFVATFGIISYFVPIYFGVIWWIVSLFVIYSAIMLFILPKNPLEYKSDLKWIIPFGLLLSLILMISTYTDQPHIQGGLEHLIKYGAAYWGYFLAVVGLVWLFQKWSPVREGSIRYSFLIYAIIPILAWTYYFIGLFPGTMTPDSLAQWEQAHTFEFINWHPVVHTWLVTVLYQIWDSPGVVSVFQIIAMALIWAYGMKTVEKIGVKFTPLLLLTIIFAIWPVTGIYSITLWKDVLYSALILLMTIYIVKIVFSKGEWLLRKRNLAAFIVTALLVMFFRHNGVPISLAMVVVLAVVYRRYWKRLALTGLIIIGTYWFVDGPLFDWVGVEPGYANEALAIPTQQIATIVTEGEVTDEQAAFINQFLEMERWDDLFHPYIVNPIKFSGYYKGDFVVNHLPEYFMLWLELVLQNPKLAFEAWAKQASLVWQVVEPPPPGYTDQYVLNIYHGNEFGLENKVINATMRENVIGYLKGSEKHFLETIWRPAIYMYEILLFTFAIFIKQRRRLVAWLIALPALFNIATVAIGLPAQDFRYLFGSVLVAMFMLSLAWIDEREISPKLD